MAKKMNIGGTISLDGDKEFKQQLTEINAGLRVNQSELQLTAAEYADNATSVEALTEKQRNLTNQIYSQTEKVRVLEKALETSRTKNGESDKATMKWQESLNKAKTELAKMNTTLGDNNNALEKAQKGTTSLADGINGLASGLGINLPPAAQKAVDKLGGISASGAALIGVLGGIVVGLSKLTMETAKTADDILTLSSTTGMTTDKIQELKYSAGLLDTSFETVDKATTRLIKSMDAAKAGTKEQTEAFKALKVKAVDPLTGKLRDSNDVFYEVVDALGKVKNETERDAIAMALMGKSARELNPLIEAGGEKMRGLAKDAHDMGYVMSEETLESFGQLDDATEKMNNQMDTLKNSLAMALLPMLTGLFKIISSIPVPVLKTIAALAGTIVTILLVVKAIQEVKSGVTGVMGLVGKFKNAGTVAKIMGIVAALVILAVVIAAIVGKMNDLKTGLSEVGGTMSGLQGTVNNAQQVGGYQRNSAATQQAMANIPQYAKGTTYHPGGLAVVGEDGPELVKLPRGSKVYPNGQSPTTGGDTFYITIDAKNVKDFNDVVSLAQNARQQRRSI